MWRKPSSGIRCLRSRHTHRDRSIHRHRRDESASVARSRRHVVVAQAAGREHAPGRDVAAGHGVGVRLLGRLPDRLRPVREEHRGRARGDLRSPAGVGFHPLPAVRHRGDPEVLQLRPGDADGAAARHPRAGVGAARRVRRGRLLRRHARHGRPLRDHGGHQGRRAPVPLPGDPQRPRRARPVLRRAGDPARPDGAAARGSRSRCTWRWTAPAGGRCCGTTGG
jgi:hypothetical protein